MVPHARGAFDLLSPHTVAACGQQRPGSKWVSRMFPTCARRLRRQRHWIVRSNDPPRDCSDARLDYGRRGSRFWSCSFRGRRAYGLSRRHSEKHTSWLGMPLGPNQTCAIAHGVRSCPGRKRCRNVGPAARLGAEDGTWQNCILAHPAIRKRWYQRLSKLHLACCFNLMPLCNSRVTGSSEFTSVFPVGCLRFVLTPRHSGFYTVSKRLHHSNSDASGR